MARSALLWLVCAASPSLAGCFALADLDSYEHADGGAELRCEPDAGEPRDLDFELVSFTPHVEDLVELRIVSNDGDLLRARALLDPLGAPGGHVVMPNAVPAGSHRIELIADDNQNRAYDDPPVDHVWVLDPCNGPFQFSHSADWVPVDEPTGRGRDFQIAFESMNAEGQQFELRISEKDTGRTVGFYFLPSVDEPNFIIAIPDIIANEGFDYEIAFYSDRNGNGKYDPPPEDEAWRYTASSDGGDLEEVFPHAEEYVDIEF